MNDTARTGTDSRTPLSCLNPDELPIKAKELIKQLNSTREGGKKRREIPTQIKHPMWIADCRPFINIEPLQIDR